MTGLAHPDIGVNVLMLATHITIAGKLHDYIGARAGTAQTGRSTKDQRASGPAIHYMGPPEGGSFASAAGVPGDNVNLADTMQMASALIHADKRFEMLVFPGMRHPYRPIASYVLVRRMDFFAHRLLGPSDTNPNIPLLQNEKQHMPSTRFIE